MRQIQEKPLTRMPQGNQESVDSENAEPTMSPEELAQAETDAQKKSVVESYNNLGLVQVSGYLNMRESASKDAKVIGKLLGGSACEILDDRRKAGIR